jgi:RNA polymerase sigma-70 factor, ECF subfamily
MPSSAPAYGWNFLCLMEITPYSIYLNGNGVKGRNMTMQNQGALTDSQIQHYEMRLKTYVARRVASIFDQEDIVQDVLLRLQASSANWNDPRQITTWLFTTAHNAIVDYYRARGKRDQPVEQAVSSTDLKTLNRALSRCLVPMLDELPSGDRAVLQLSMSGLALPEVARKLHVSTTCVKSRAQRGRKKLRSLLLQCCAVETDRRGNILDARKRHDSQAHPCPCPPLE